MNLLRNYTGTIRTRTVSTVNGKPVISEPTDIEISCTVTENAGGHYTVDASGNKIQYKYLVCCDLFDEAGPDLEGQGFIYKGRELTINKCFVYTRHVELNLI